ncbi:uncharacterized protein LOC107266713 [Cephus cinctus]|uniref:Uncharacterized protein LOC107266713 n=1 Tax=Cephus cinctus TaxID=211228 RepID=A0AAJ7BS57_CEPCN|nr:uncharacterized protein LOC107266713 [Cephus cinctus]
MGIQDTVEVVDDRPKWMINLENRKRKPRLAHEAGAGAPCLICKTSCPGLDLHFWRKICKICKCSRDDHDVDDDEFPQFDLLLGPSGRPKKKATFLRVPIKKLSENEMPFEWIPPDTTKELATDYMKALPEDKLPIKGSAGAALRRQQLQKQFPIHDIDHKACDELSEEERKQFEKYLENLKKYVGQGTVIKMMGARPYSASLMARSNPPETQRIDSQQVHQISAGQSLNLRTPSSFVPKIPPLPSTDAMYNQQFELYDNTKSNLIHLAENTPQLPWRSEECPHVLANVLNDAQIAMSGKIDGGTYNPAQYFPYLGKIGNQEYELASELKDSNAHVPQRTHFTGKMESIPQQQTDMSTTGVKVETNPVRQFAQEEIVPIGTKQSSHNIARSDTLNNNENYSKMTGSPYETQTVRVQQTPGNLIENSKLRGSQYCTNAILTEDNPELIEVTGDQEDIEKKLIAILQANLPDHMKNERILPENTAEESSRLAEEMLNEALLPPSAVHNKEIIGSTLDRNELKYIQEKLSAKYSKDDPIPHNTIRSEELHSRSPQHIYNLSKIKESQSKNIPFSVDKEAERAAIIAAMRNPSGTLSSEEILEKMAPKYSSPLREGEYLQHQKYNVPLNNIHYPQHTEPSLQQQFHDQELRPIPDSLPPISGQSVYSNVHNQQREIKPQQHQCNPGMDINSSTLPYQAQAQYSENCKPNKNRNINDPLQLNQERLVPHQLQAELSYSPVHSNVIHSESLKNPVFPEGMVGAPQLAQNPSSVDQLRGAMEQLSVMPIQQKCHQCQEPIHVGDVVVTAQMAKDAVWHPGCFACSICNELLADLIYFYHTGKLYCGRDLATLLQIPRCFGCDELIFVREYTVAEGHNYHVRHFCCWDCDMPLAGQQYISENDRPLCLPCYQKTYAKTCSTCMQVIAADQQGVAVKNLDFHATDKCFCCFTCKKSLLNGKMAIKEDKPFCSKECIMQFMSQKA